MSSKPLDIEDLRDLINAGKSKDPLVFLESIMNGYDPRELSELYRLVCEIDEFSDGKPSAYDWQELMNLVHAIYKYKPVSLSESVNASKTLAEYLYAKRKQVDINGADGVAGAVDKTPLTEDEIELFKEKFNEEF